jgi:p70 ribosomal S6 kinase
MAAVMPPTPIIPDACDQLEDFPASGKTDQVPPVRHDEMNDCLTEFHAASSMDEPPKESSPSSIIEAIEQKNDATTNDNKQVQVVCTTTTPATKRFASPKDFELLKVIGMGAFGKVLQVRNKRDQQVLAMKVISKRLINRGSGYVENIRAERDILTRVKHPFVVRMYCSFQTTEKLFIIMDYLAGGELFLRLGREGIFLEKTASFYLAEIILALKHLHSRGILHRDLKPENILLGSDGHICVTDFGLAKDFGEAGFQDDGNDSRSFTIAGTNEYLAPEMVARQGYGRAADYWSLGILAFEMLQGDPPFRSKLGAKDLFRKIMTERVKMPSTATPAACKLLKGLLNRNPHQRWGVAKSTMFEVGGVSGLQQAEFFKGYDWDKLEKKEVEPPDIFEVSAADDTRHFHGEFTTMAIPRSVLIMAIDEYKPRRVESDHFRGFSFIQEDFDLPDRDEAEVDMYWNSVQRDALSESDCASSKCDADPTHLQLFTPDKKKRPPRKRKNKKPGAITDYPTPTPGTSTQNTPSTSAAPSPTVSACSSPIPFDMTLNTPATVPQTNGVDSPQRATIPNGTTEPKQESEPADVQRHDPVANITKAPVVKKPEPHIDAWQEAAGKKNKPKAFRDANITHTSRRTANPTTNINGSPAAPAWNTNSLALSNPNSRRGPWSNAASTPSSAIPPRPIPSSDWTQHRMSPRKIGGSQGKSLEQVPLTSSGPMWPSLTASKPSAAPSKPDASSQLAVVVPLSKGHPTKLQGVWSKKN